MLKEPALEPSKRPALINLCAERITVDAREKGLTGFIMPYAGASCKGPRPSFRFCLKVESHCWIRSVPERGSVGSYVSLSILLRISYVQDRPDATAFRY